MKSCVKDGRTVLKLGLCLLVIAVLALRFLHPNAYLSEDLADALKGFLFGVSAGCLFVAVYRMQTRSHTDHCS